MMRLNRLSGSPGKKRFNAVLALLAVALLVAFAKLPIRSTSAASGTAISLTTLGTPYTQDFNTLANSGTSSAVPQGWAFSESGTNANTTYTAGTGSSNAGETYSFGATGNTERAFGGLQSGNLIPTIGACFTNNTASVITSLAISYTGEEWRLGTAARADRLDFQFSTNATSLTTGAWTDVDALDFSTPNTAASVGALDGNAAANRTAISFTLANLNIANGVTFFIRWNDFNASGADDGLSVDDFSITPNGTGGGPPSLSINNVTVAEGNSGTTAANFTVSLSAPAGAGGVTFDIATQDNTATLADNDYIGRMLNAQTIPEGSQTFNFAVDVNGDTTAEPDESFFVNVTNITGAVAGDVQGAGTISNDDFSAIPIHTIQGNSTASPFVGQVITTTGIVTGVKSNGFFIQAPDAEADGDPNTSEGVFVFTSSAPPATAAAGNSVAVMGTVQEFIPSADLNSPPTTELGGSLTVTLISTGNPLPAPVTLTAADTNPAGSIQQLEKYEGMRVHVNSLTVIAPTQGTISEANATATSNGVFYGVISGVPRPFREPGLEIPDPAPAGSPCCIPRFDANPERLRVDSDALTATMALNVTTGAIVMNITGPLDYAFRTYTILPDPGSPLVATGNISAIPVPAPGADEFTVGSFNMERFFDTTDDAGISDVALTVTAFNNRLNKASLAIRNVLRMPDILGIEEMENLTTLQAVANKVNNDAVAAGGANPNYQAFLVEGNDIGGIDVGFLVKGSRVTVIDVTQVGKDATYTEPGGTQALLNDRPSLVLRATITAPDTSQFPITVIVNHLRSLSGVDDPVDGNRVRTKRRAQAEFLANLIQARQTADPNERIISVGDYNAFQFNDGYTDSIGTIKGTPTPANEVTLASGDLVNPDLTDLLDMAPPDQRYSFSFDGNAQSLDHELITANLLSRFSRIVYARNDADFPEIFRSDPDRPERISDHDMPIAYFKFSPAACSFSLSSPGQAFTSSGGDGSVDVLTTSGCNWTAVSNDSWIVITSAASGTGNGAISFSVRENTSSASRTGTITIGGLTFTVTEDGASAACTYSISPAGRSFDANGGTATVSVTTAGGCNWIATSNVSWITINSGGSGSGNGTVSYTVAANTGAQRTGTMLIAGRTFTVKQKKN